MRGIEEAIEKTNGDGLYTGGSQNAHGIVHRGLVKHGFHTAVVQQPFRHFAAQGALDQYRRFVRLQIVEVGPFLPADFQEVAKPVAGDQTG